MNSIKEKFAQEILEECQNGTSVSNLVQILTEYLDAELENVQRYGQNYSDLMKDPNGEFIQYDDLHS